jgi:hypothetical protein
MKPEETYEFLSIKNIYVTPTTEDYFLRPALRMIEHPKMWEHLLPLREKKIRNEYLPPLYPILLLRIPEIGVNINLDKGDIR